MRISNRYAIGRGSSVAVPTITAPVQTSALPEILRVGTRVKVPTSQGFERWTDLRASGKTTEEADEIVYDRSEMGRYWTAQEASL